MLIPLLGVARSCSPSIPPSSQPSQMLKCPMPSPASGWQVERDFPKEEEQHGHLSLPSFLSPSLLFGITFLELLLSATYCARGWVTIMSKNTSWPYPPRAHGQALMRWLWKSFYKRFWCIGFFVWLVILLCTVNIIYINLNSYPPSNIILWPKYSFRKFLVIKIPCILPSDFKASFIR